MHQKLFWLFLFFCFVFYSCEKNDDSLTVFFTGDLLLDRGVRKQIEIKGSDALFEKIKPLFARGDFTVANLECPITKRISPVNKKYIFRAEPEWLPAVKNAGITHLILANNHSNDQGRKGISDTYENIKAYGMNPVGYGINQPSACEPIIIEKKNIRVALFSSVTLALENWNYLPDSAGICQATVNDLITSISSFKKKEPDTYVVVILHWGIEFQKSPTVIQRFQAKQLIDSGADVLIGHHPHIVQEHVVYKGKHIFFSLGNFVFDQKQPGDEALIVEMNFGPKGIGCTQHPIAIKNCVPELSE